MPPFTSNERERYEVQTTIDKERYLNTIMVPPGQRASDAYKYKEIAELREIPEWSVPQYLRDLYELSLPVENNMATSFTDRITEMVAQVRLDVLSTISVSTAWLMFFRPVLSPFCGRVQTFERSNI
jgi:hypothetical protein